MCRLTSFRASLARHPDTFSETKPTKENRQLSAKWMGKPQKNVVPVVGLDQIFKTSHKKLKPFGSGNFHKCCNGNDFICAALGNQANTFQQPPTTPSAFQHF
jgi:hypothetical protein